jgi:hypothetical protein
MVELVQIIRVAPGRYDDFLKRRAAIKSIRDRTGAPIARYMRIMSGANSGSLAVILTFADWRAFGDYNQKLRADPEFRKLTEQTRGDPQPAVTLVDAIITESLEE